MKYFDRKTNSWIELDMDDNGELVVVGPGEPASSVAIPTKNVNPALGDTTLPPGYGKELETAAKLAMQEEQKQKGFQDNLELGLAFATENNEDQKKVEDGARRSTKQALITASNILNEKANMLAGSNPELAKTYQEYALYLKDFQGQIQTKMQDAWWGANLRYGTPIGSGKEGTPYGSRHPGSLDYIRPELSGKTYQEAMDDTLRTEFGKQTLGNRIDERKRYYRENPYVSIGAGLVPVASQWRSMKDEGLNLSDLNANGAFYLGSSAATQGLGYLAPATGPMGIGASVALNTTSDLLGTPERPDSDDANKDFARDAVTSAVGGALPAAPSVAKKVLKGTKTKGVPTAKTTPSANPELDKKIEINRKAIADYQNRLNEQMAIASGNPEAMQNAFVKAAIGQEVAPEDAWKFSTGYLADDAGVRISNESPWIDYARKELSSAKTQSSELSGKLGKAKQAQTDAELSLRQASETAPTKENVDINKEHVKNLKELNDSQRLDELVELEKRINTELKPAYEKASKRELNDNELIRISTLEERIKKANELLQSVDSEKAPKTYAKTKDRLDMAQINLNKVKETAENRINKTIVNTEKALKNARAKLKSGESHLGEEPRTRGYLTSKRQLRESESRFKHKSETHGQDIEKLQKNLDDARAKVEDLERQLASNRERLAWLESPEIEESFKKGAENILKRDAESQAKKLEESIGLLNDRNELLMLKQQAKGQSQSRRGSPFVEAAKDIVLSPVRGQLISLGGELGTTMGQPEHRDNNVDDNVVMGDPLERYSISFIPRFTGLSGNSKTRVNKYRGFNK